MAHSMFGEDGRVTVACFKCSEGCIHLEYANLMMTFTVRQFLTLSEVIAETRRRLLQESEQTELLEAHGQHSPLVM